MLFATLCIHSWHSTFSVHGENTPTGFSTVIRKNECKNVHNERNCTNIKYMILTLVILSSVFYIHDCYKHFAKVTGPWALASVLYPLNN